MIVPEVAGAASELVQPGADAVRAAKADPELVRMGLHLLRAEWSTLAIVSVGTSAAARRVAGALVEAAQSCRLRPVRTVDAIGAPASQVSLLLDELATSRGTYPRTAIMVDDPASSPASIPLVLAADASVLLVRLGRSELKTLEKAADLIGHDRLVGCIAVR